MARGQPWEFLLSMDVMALGSTEPHGMARHAGLGDCGIWAWENGHCRSRQAFRHFGSDNANAMRMPILGMGMVPEWGMRDATAPATWRVRMRRCCVRMRFSILTDGSAHPLCSLSGFSSSPENHFFPLALLA